MAYRKTEHVEARLADKRKRILAAAARALVGEGGWPEAQVSHVAAAAGLATGTVYRYFPSKADLFVEVLSAVSQREVDVLQAIADADEPPRQRLHAAVTGMPCTARPVPLLPPLTGDSLEGVMSGSLRRLTLRALFCHRVYPLRHGLARGVAPLACLFQADVGVLA